MKLKLIVCYVLFFIRFYSQGGVDAISALNKITPTSPNSTNFEKYGMNPVNLSAGVVSPSIPLVSIPVGNNSFSVNLNYSTQGIRVDEFASTVGIGWNVNLGSITRNIRDLADEQGGTLKELPSLTGDNLFYIGNSLSQDLALDSEYDVFNVNVDGLSTKFMLENDAQLNFTIKKLIKDDTKVEFVGTAADISNGNLNTPVLLVTSPNGTKYYFGGNGGVETSFTRPLNVGGIPPTMYTTAWMISRIEYVNQKSVDFYYTQNQIIYNDGISQSSTIKFAVPDNTNSGLPQLLGANTSVSYNRNRMSVPDRIVSDGITVKFNKSVFSNYISNYPNITSIELQHNNVINKKIIFNYDYYQSINKGSNTYSESIKRPFLSKLEFEDMNNSIIDDYRFEYYSPDQLPHRLSFSQDLLGYYNGANNSNFIFNSLKDYNVLPGYNTIKQTEDEFNNFIYSVSGNRRPNIGYAINGSLKKIIYPTKGYTLFEYDGNRTDIRETVYPSYNTSLGIQILPDINSTMNPVTYLNNVTVPFDQNFYITGYNNSKENIDPDSEICQPSEIHDKSSFTMYEGTQPLTIYTVSVTGNISQSTGAQTFPMGNEYYFNTNSQVRMYAKLQANKSYNIRLSNRKCMTSIVNFAYYNSLPYEGDYIEAGGLRVKTIINKDSNDNQISKKSYDYADGSYINGKPLSVLDKKDIEVQMLSESGLSVMAVAYTKDYTMTSGTRNSLKNSLGEFYAYSKVNEYDYDNNNISKGRTEHFFDVYQIAPPVAIQNYDTSSGNFIEMVSSINESKTDFFDNVDKVKSISYQYGLNQNYLNQRHNAFTAKKTLEIRCTSYGSFNSPTACGEGVGTGGIHITADDRWWSIMKSYKGEIWETLNSKSTIDYMSGVPLTTTIEYFYTNPSHYQLTSQKTTFPDSSYQITDYSYAHEKGKQLMIAANMVGIPLVTENKKNGNTISKTETIYPDVLPDTQTGNLLVPKSVSSLDLVIGNLSTEITYNQYDTKGNLQQYTTKSGVPTAIIWGYNNTQPIAKVEGATYSEVSGYISNIVTKSDADNTTGTTASEQDLVDALDLFKKTSQLSGFQITTYSYDPLIGVKSITPPNGVRQVYIYDNANRLKEVREHSQSGNLLKEYQYNYKHD